jgi:hypothetical protein
MPNSFIGSVADIIAYDGNDILFTARSLTESTMNVAVEKLEIRGGKGNVRFGQFFHTSAFSVNITDALFNLKYISANVGNAVAIGGSALQQESVTLAAGGNGTVVGTPIAWGTAGTIGWASLASDQDTWQTVTFTGSAFAFSGGTSGQVVCVKFLATEAASTYVTIPGNIIPKTLKLVMTANLYGAASATATLVGRVEVIVDRFVLDGVATLNLTSNGVATQSLSGTANAVFDSTCANGTRYAIITVVPTSGTWYDNITMLAFGDATPAISAGTPTYTIISYGVAPGFAPYLITVPTDLTFVSSTVGVATVSAAGVITRVGAGSTTITVTVTAKPAIQGTLLVTSS